MIISFESFLEYLHRGHSMKSVLCGAGKILVAIILMAIPVLLLLINQKLVSRR